MSPKAGGQQMRVVDQVFQVVQHGKRDIGAVEQRDPVGIAAGGDNFGHFAPHRAEIGLPPLHGGKDRVGGEVGAIHQFEEAAPMRVVVRQKAQMPIQRAERPPHRAPHRFVAHRALRRIEHVAAEMLGGVERDHRLQHRHADILALPGAQPMEQRQHDGVGGMHGGDLVGDNRGHIARLAAHHGLQHGKPRQRLHHVVVGRFAGIGAEVGKPLHVAIDQARIGGRQRSVVDAQPSGGGRAGRMQQHIAAAGHPAQRGQRARVLQIQHDAALVAVIGQEQRAHLVGLPRADGPRDIAVRRFDLDDVRPHVAQVLGRHRPQYDGGQIEHGDSGQRPGVAHGRRPSPA